MVGTPNRIGPTAVRDRALAPDVARGAMLLLIALANAHLYLYGQGNSFHAYPTVDGGADRWVTLLQMTLVDGRAYPMFAALFGYGLVQLYRRRTAAGEDQPTATALLRRRGWWLIVFGAVHGVVLFSGDIIGAYGLLAVVLSGWLLAASDRHLLLFAAVWLIPAVGFGAVEGIPMPEDQGSFPSLSETSPIPALGFRIVEWVFGAFVAQAFVPLPAAVIFGMWAARHHLLDIPERHRGVLIRTATIGLTVGAAGGLPLALITAGVWSTPPTAASVLVSGLHAATGYAGGLGYAALAGLVALRALGRKRDGEGEGGSDRHRGRVVTALAACGQWSMSCYLAQSVVFVLILAAYGGGLGDQLGVAPTAALATTTWLLTLAVSTLLQQRGLRGPAESLLRHLTYTHPNSPPPVDKHQPPHPTPR